MTENEWQRLELGDVIKSKSNRLQFIVVGKQAVSYEPGFVLMVSCSAQAGNREAWDMVPRVAEKPENGSG